MTNTITVSMRRAAVLLLLSLLAQGCGPRDGLSDYEREQRKQGHAATAIKEAGGEVHIVHYPQGDGYAVNLSGAQIKDAIFANMKILSRVAELDLSKSSITDSQLVQLNEQDVGTLIYKLDLSYTAVTDAGLEKLTGLNVLGHLKLIGTKVTAAGVERFKKQRLTNPKNLIKDTNIVLK